jgi:hypothetical protein
VSVWNGTTGAWTGNAVTNASGVYSITLPQGGYKLYIQGGSPTYPGQFFGGTSMATATIVRLGAANLTQNITVH